MVKSRDLDIRDNVGAAGVISSLWIGPDPYALHHEPRT